MTRTLTTLMMISLLALSPAKARQAADSVTKRLEAEMYRYYSSDSTEKFRKATDELKEICLAAGNEHLFYKTWGNQAIYYFNRVNRKEGLAMAETMLKHAQQHQHKFGLYTSTYVTGTIMSTLHNMKEARKNFIQAIDYQHRFFPDESAAAPYLALARLAHNEKRYEEEIEYAEKALAEPAVSLTHQVMAGSHKCIGYAELDMVEEFYDAYNQREKAKQLYGHDDNLGFFVEVYKYTLSGQYDKALTTIQDFPTAGLPSQLEMRSKIYFRQGNYKAAYLAQVRYKALLDSINNEEIQRQANEYAQEIQLSQARMEAHQQAVRSQHILYAAAATVAVVIAFMLAIILWRRRQQMGQLQALNDQLQSVNRQLKVSEQAEHEARTAAEKALQVKRHFLNNISHEMRTPLNSIAGFAEVLTMPGLELPQEEKADLNHRIQENTTMLTSIIDRMLELSYYDSLTKLDTTQEVYVNALCHQLTERHREQATASVALSFTSALPDDYSITTNEPALTRLIDNLLDNALRFTLKGKVNLHAAPSTTDGLTVFSVTDTGPGIPRERRDQLFSPFAETDHQVQTVGVGLSICHTICQLLGGNISLDESYTHGTRIVFTIGG